MSFLKRIFPGPSLPSISLTEPAEKEALRERHEQVIQRLDNLRAELTVIRRSNPNGARKPHA